MKKILLSILAIFLIIEEWLWDFLSALAHYLFQLLRLEKFEIWLSQTTPNKALLAFIIPILIVTPINIAAIWLLLQGLFLQGLLLEVLAKLLGTLMVARVFTLTKTQLLTFKPIALVYNTISSWLHWAHAKVVDTAIYRYAKQLKAQIKASIRGLFQKGNVSKN